MYGFGHQLDVWVVPREDPEDLVSESQADKIDPRKIEGGLFCKHPCEASVLCLRSGNQGAAIVLDQVQQERADGRLRAFNLRRKSVDKGFEKFLRFGA